MNQDLSSSSCDLYLNKLFRFGRNFQPFREKQEKPRES